MVDDDYGIGLMETSTSIIFKIIRKDGFDLKSTSSSSPSFLTVDYSNTPNIVSTNDLRWIFRVPV
jgi:hypothetical protein